MSKLDAQRAMREARYAARNSSGPTRRQAAAGADPATAAPSSSAAKTDQPVATTGATAKPKRTPKAAPGRAAAAETGTVAEGPRCGHTSMNGRSCTRPAGHSEKSHRYS